jgi:hypothetical protein
MMKWYVLIFGLASNHNLSIMHFDQNGRIEIQIIKDLQIIP